MHGNNVHIEFRATFEDDILNHVHNMIGGPTNQLLAVMIHSNIMTVSSAIILMVVFFQKSGIQKSFIYHLEVIKGDFDNHFSYH